MSEVSSGHASAVSVSALRLVNEPSSVADARRWLRTLLSERAVASDRIDDAMLVISELASNAIRHASDHVLCHAVLDPDTCTLSVADDGAGTPAIATREPHTVGGLGLVIVERLSRRWGVAPFDGGKVVFAVLDATRAG